jgi:hypothetical protein
LVAGAETAIRLGERDNYLAALKELDFRLSEDADEWGESRETLEALDIEMRCGTCRVITALYGVHRSKPLVFVKTLRLHKRYRG